MDTSIYTLYTPYFYIIQHINSGKYYAGVRYGKNANPDQLLKSNGYQTSSYIVKQIILEEGLESFVIRTIKVFETAEQALDYESRFLKRVNASFNDNFLNRSNNSISTLNVDYEKNKQIFLAKYGFENPSCVPEFQEKRKQTFLKNYGVSHPNKAEELKEKRRKSCLEIYGVEYSLQAEEVKEKGKQTCLIKYGVEHPMQSPEFQEKNKKTCLRRYGVEYPSQSEEIKDKKKQTCLKNFGVESPMQSEEVKEKHKQNFLEKYGVENPSQSLEVQEKKRQNRIALHNRPTVLEIRKYIVNFKLKLGNSWYWKPQEFLDNMLEEIKITYGLYY